MGQESAPSGGFLRGLMRLNSRDAPSTTSTFPFRDFFCNHASHHPRVREELGLQVLLSLLAVESGVACVF